MYESRHDSLVTVPENPSKYCLRVTFSELAFAEHSIMLGSDGAGNAWPRRGRVIRTPDETGELAPIHGSSRSPTG